MNARTVRASVTCGRPVCGICCFRRARNCRRRQRFAAPTAGREGPPEFASFGLPPSPRANAAVAVGEILAFSRVSTTTTALWLVTRRRKIKHTPVIRSRSFHIWLNDIVRFYDTLPRAQKRSCRRKSGLRIRFSPGMKRPGDRRYIYVHPVLRIRNTDLVPAVFLIHPVAARGVTLCCAAPSRESGAFSDKTECAKAKTAV